MTVRALLRGVADLLAFGWSTGRWWMPVVVSAFIAASVMALTVKTVVLPALYVLF